MQSTHAEPSLEAPSWVKPKVAAVVSGLGLFGAYIGILTVANSFSHAVEQFAQWWYWIAPLIVGFSIQVGLYSHIRASRHHVASSTSTVAATGGVSTGSMAACCAHHGIDVLPVLGLSAAATVLEEYQGLIMTGAVLSNLIGISLMLGVMRDHELFAERRGRISKLQDYDFQKIRNGLIVAAVVILFALSLSYAGVFSNVLVDRDAETSLKLPSRINDEAGVTFEVLPVDFEPGKPITFAVSIDTHEGNLDFDLTETSELQTSDGSTYKPLNWDGPPPGGHHRQGLLTFPATVETDRLKLTIRNVYGVPLREFEWTRASAGSSNIEQSNMAEPYVIGAALTAAIGIVGVSILKARNNESKYEEHFEREYRRYKADKTPK